MAVKLRMLGGMYLRVLEGLGVFVRDVYRGGGRSEGFLHRIILGLAIIYSTKVMITIWLCVMTLSAFVISWLRIRCQWLVFSYRREVLLDPLRDILT